MLRRLGALTGVIFAAAVPIAQASSVSISGSTYTFTDDAGDDSGLRVSLETYNSFDEPPPHPAGNYLAFQDIDGAPSIAGAPGCFVDGDYDDSRAWCPPPAGQATLKLNFTGGENHLNVDYGFVSIPVTGGTGADSVNVDESLSPAITFAGNGGGDSLNAPAAGAVNFNGGEGNDRASTGGAVDSLSGGDGRDTLESGAGNDALDGGTGDDTLFAGDGDDNLTGGDGADDLEGQGGSDTITAGLGDDTVVGGDGNDVINGGEGFDSLDGGNGDDKLTGENGEDSLYGGEGADELRAGAGKDFADGNGGNDFVYGETEDDIVEGGEGNDVLEGGDGADSVRGEAGADNVRGDGGDDVVWGGSDADTVSGGEGNDTLEGGNYGSSGEQSGGRDDVSGGAGLDTAGYADRSTGVTITLDDQPNDGGGGEGDNVRADVENLIGSGGPDTITGSAIANVIDANSGDDTVDGGAGDDDVTGSGGNDKVSGGAGNDQVAGSSADDTVDGGPGADTMRGDDPCTISGCSGGSDLMIARDGEADNVNCGVGADTAQVDQLDVVATDFQQGCEAIERQAATPAGPGGPAGGGATTGDVALGKPTLRALRSSGLKFKVTCLAACSISATLRVDARTAKKLGLKRGKPLGTTKATLGAAGVKSMQVKVAAKLRKKLKRIKSVKLTLKVTTTDSASKLKRTVTKGATAK